MQPDEVTRARPILKEMAGWEKSTEKARKLSDLPSILLKGAVTTAVVMFLIGASSGMSWLLTTQNIPHQVSAGLLALSDNPVVLLLTINLRRLSRL